MAYRRERPRCRKVIEELLGQQNCTLDQLLENPHRLSDGLRIQARKMLEEQKARERPNGRQNPRQERRSG